MRLWLRDSERRADPEPVQTDDRRPMLIGTALWFVALTVMLVLVRPITAHGNSWMVWTCGVGLALGLIGLAYTHRRQRRRQ